MFCERFVNALAVAAVVVPIAFVSPAVQAQRVEFPFGSEMTLDAPPMRGSKRIPVIEIGDSGEVQLDLYCKRGQGQFSVAGDSVIFIPGAIDGANCSADRAQADDALLATLSSATSWRRQGDFVTFVGGARPLRFHLNTN